MKNVNVCDDCGKTVIDRADYYMIKDELWSEFGNEKGMLCLACMEKRLGREITHDDLTNCAVNWSHPRWNGIQMDMNFDAKTTAIVHNDGGCLRVIDISTEEKRRAAYIYLFMSNMNKNLFHVFRNIASTINKSHPYHKIYQKMLAMLKSALAGDWDSMVSFTSTLPKNRHFCKAVGFSGWIKVPYMECILKE